MADGEIIVYAFPGVEWSEGHLASIAAHFTSRNIEALITSGEYVSLSARGHEKPAVIRRQAQFFGSPIAAQTCGLGEGVPLATFVHRRGLIDRFGRFDERLAHLAESDFVWRMFARVATALDTQQSIALRERDDEPSAALRDPSAYLATLKWIYSAQQVEPLLAARRSAHLETLTEAAMRYTRGDASRSTAAFTALARGV